jgi:hypothetical protein
MRIAMWIGGLFIGLIYLPAIAGPHQVVDLRNQSDADGLEREISLCARPSPVPPSIAGLPGHAFVAFAQSNGDNWSYDAIGHTTSTLAPMTILTYTGLIPSVPGYLGNENYTSTKEECLVFQVNKQAYDVALSYVKSPLDQLLAPDAPRPPILLAYSLAGDDCITYATQVINSILPPDKPLPARGALELPETYVRRVIDTFTPPS